MGRAVLVAALAALLVAFVAAKTTEEEEVCGECDRTACPEVTSCSGGLVEDICGCCNICSGRLGDRCQNETEQNRKYTACGEYLVCKLRDDLYVSSDEATCKCAKPGAACGSDGKTYETLCHLLEAGITKPDLFVQERGPCISAPVIKTVPEGAERPLGGIMVLDCEAVGFPVPTISWDLYRPDGSTVTLPSDDSAVAVQIRGGPEKYMVTGWVQIMQISKENVGTYICVASNSVGVDRASAVLSYYGQENEL